ncbi:sterol desaturase family protein [Sorangium sp. So ce128]|uniref:sterol desaturase family protein n=1 Tax=Sorangium sp. So ce128 TaxID=3133281 RepID=UPI003F62AD6E
MSTLRGAMFRDPADARRLAVVAAAEVILLGIGVWSGGGALAGALFWAAGLAGWTLIEYLLHRFLFHLPAEHPLAFLGARIHLAHHEAPDQTPIVKPPAATLGAFSAGFCATAAAAGVSRAAPLWAGLVAGYLLYELSHLAAHLLGDAEHPLPAQRRHHLRHHAAPRARFGVSSALWDRAFDTGREAGQ